MSFKYNDKVKDLSGCEGIVVDETIGGGKVTVRITKSSGNSIYRTGQRVNILVSQLQKK